MDVDGNVLVKVLSPDAIDSVYGAATGFIITGVVIIIGTDGVKPGVAFNLFFQFCAAAAT
jgi:hypothetical protein